MAALLRVTEHDFIQQFTRLAADRQGLALTDQPGGACVFLEGRHCRVNEAKPIQCREFPHRWNNPGWERYCAGAKTITDFSKADGL
jgi:Fe-S-cluster containining protein